MRLALAFALCAGPALAGWEVRTDVEAVLSDRTVDYDGAWQSFEAGGATSYLTDRPSAGRWAEREGRYCSQWPPSGRWDCYALEVSEDGARVRFVDDRGHVTEGAFRE